MRGHKWLLLHDSVFYSGAVGLACPALSHIDAEYREWLSVPCSRSEPLNLNASPCVGFGARTHFSHIVYACACRYVKSFCVNSSTYRTRMKQQPSNTTASTFRGDSRPPLKTRPQTWLQNKTSVTQTRLRLHNRVSVCYFT